MGCERIDLDAADDRRDVVHRAVAALAGGRAVVAPGDHGALPLGLVHHPEALFGIPAMRGEAALILPSPESLRDWIPRLSARARRMIGRAWPGSTAFHFGASMLGGLAERLPRETRAMLVDEEGGITFRCPGHPFFRELCPFLPCPAFTLGETAARASDDSDRYRMIIESRPKKREDEPTVVKLGSEGWSVLRTGSVSREELARMDGTMILFVCTGNTCRSPMAEALCKVLIAERLGCSPDELEEKGYLIASAGVYAGTGQPAASHAVEVVKSRGGSLREHFSRRLTPEMVAKADLLIAMTIEHLEAMLDVLPDSADRARLLHPEGLDVADPYGADRATYQRTAEEIEAYLARLLDDLGVRAGGA